MAQLKQQYEKDLCNSLLALLDLIIEGKIPDDVLAVLYGATLTGIGKKSGGIRPIAVGNVYRRLAAKIICQRLKSDVSSKLRPVQLGFEVRGGAEAIIHTVRDFISHEHDCKLVMKLDFVNAFNTVRRDVLLDTVNRELSVYSRFIWQCHRTASVLNFGDYRISSEMGLHQGDPLGPVLFSLVILPLTTSMQSNLNLCGGLR